MKNRGKMREAERGIYLLYNEEENIVLTALNIRAQNRTEQFVCNKWL